MHQDIWDDSMVLGVGSGVTLGVGGGEMISILTATYNDFAALNNMLQGTFDLGALSQALMPPSIPKPLLIPCTT